MERDKSSLPGGRLQLGDSWGQSWTNGGFEQDQIRSTNQHWPFSIKTASRKRPTDEESSGAIERRDGAHRGKDFPAKTSEMTLAEFVEHKFVPEHVATKRSAGRAHFQAILKHVLTPEQVDRAFRVDEEKSKVKLRAIEGWPYLDAMRLSDVRPDQIQQIIARALERGYSTQTATHIRNVIRTVFSHANKVRCFVGENPAASVILPGMARKEAHALTLDQLKQVILVMRYPERQVALLGILTEMSVAEICGLQWKCVNLSDVRHMIDGEWIPPRTIAVRKQSYRGEFSAVLGSRNRDLPVPDLLGSILQSLKTQTRFTSREDFVVSSRTGTPINQDNIAARRLKSIGKRLEMPWLSWHVFHRTHVTLNAEFGRQLPNELKKALPLEAIHRRQSRDRTGNF